VAERFNFLSRIMIGFEGTEVPDYLPDLVESGLRSIALYGENIQDRHQLKELIAELKSVLGPDGIISLDEEGGDVTRVDYLTGSRFAGNGYLGAIDDVELTERDGTMIAELLRFYGINLNLAPVADVNSEPKNPVIGTRSFGTDQELVARHVAAFVKGHQGAGVGVTLKHFPGHGNVISDSHATLPKVPGGLGELRAKHWLPFEAGIAQGAAAVMLGHLDLGDSVPATLSKTVVAILREQLGFEGLVITDAMDMGALGPRAMMPRNSVEAALVGNDIICMGPRTLQGEIEKILILWDAVDTETKERSMGYSAKRMASFIDKQKALAIPAEPTPSYPNQNINFDIRGATVLRLISSSNPAVGEVPWYPGVTAQEITIEGLGLLDESNKKTVLLVREPNQLSQISKMYNQGLLKGVRVISSTMTLPEFGPDVIVTNGAAQPQAALVNKLLSKES
jgi:beta-N-acetylhexosaminidase